MASRLKSTARIGGLGLLLLVVTWGFIQCSSDSGSSSTSPAGATTQFDFDITLQLPPIGSEEGSGLLASYVEGGLSADSDDDEGEGENKCGNGRCGPKEDSESCPRDCLCTEEVGQEVMDVDCTFTLCNTLTSICESLTQHILACCNEDGCDGEGDGTFVIDTSAIDDLNETLFELDVTCVSETSFVTAETDVHPGGNECEEQPDGTFHCDITLPLGPLGFTLSCEFWEDVALRAMRLLNPNPSVGLHKTVGKVRELLGCPFTCGDGWCDCPDGVCEGGGPRCPIGAICIPLLVQAGHIDREPFEDPTTCPVDCKCGDGECTMMEDSESCAADCACGDGVCDEGEEEGGRSACLDDCDLCGNEVCDLAEGEIYTDECRKPFSGQDDCFHGDGVCDDLEAFDKTSESEVLGDDGDCFCGGDFGTCDADETAVLSRTDPNSRDYDPTLTFCSDCFCGDGVCRPLDGENATNCKDCAVCGDEILSPKEDCDGPLGFCERGRPCGSDTCTCDCELEECTEEGECSEGLECNRDNGCCEFAGPVCGDRPEPICDPREDPHNPTADPRDLCSDDCCDTGVSCQDVFGDCEGFSGGFWSCDGDDRDPRTTDIGCCVSPSACPGGLPDCGFILDNGFFDCSDVELGRLDCTRVPRETCCTF